MSDESTSQDTAPDAPPASGKPRTAGELFRYWFIQYNPLYIFSALCVLAGVFLISIGLEQADWERGQLALFAVIQLYELALLTASGVLLRLAGQRRPAVMLGLFAVFFLFDCTFRIETVSGMGGLGRLLSALWVVLVVAKLTALGWVFRVRAPRWVLIPPALWATGIATIPYLLDSAAYEPRAVYLAAAWLATALLGLVLIASPRIGVAMELDEWGETVLYRVRSAVWGILFSFYLYHLWNRIIWVGPADYSSLLPQATPFLALGALLARREGWIWAAAVATLSASLAYLPALAPIAAAIAALLAWKAWRGAGRRLYVAAVLGAYLAWWSAGWSGGSPPPAAPPLSSGNLAAGAALVGLAWRLRLGSALVPLAAALVFYGQRLLPTTLLGWGVLALALGFAALLGGVALGWRYRELASRPAPPSSDAPPPDPVRRDSP